MGVKVENITRGMIVKDAAKSGVVSSVELCKNDPTTDDGVYIVFVDGEDMCEDFGTEVEVEDYSVELNDADEDVTVYEEPYEAGVMNPFGVVGY